MSLTIKKPGGCLFFLPHTELASAILLVVMIVSHFIGKGIEKIIKLSMLGWLNRMLGFLIGALMATILLSVVAYIVNYANNLLHIIPEGTFSDSQGYTLLLNFQQKIFPFLEKIFS